MSRNCGGFYLGFIIPRKMGSATKRNLFKRRCRASLSDFKKRGLLPTHGLIVKPKSISSTFSEINAVVSDWILLNNKKEVV
jgi:ribonuclease P protein component|tara:strand:- start:15008 stop:15250 length:243 start_codon:yes stop_codon:yes gene_type:complete